MHGPAAVAEVLALRAEGLGARRIASRTGLPVATVRDWLAGRLPKHSRNRDRGVEPRASCERCGHFAHDFERLPPAYVYLLGLYLGDGCISEHRRSVFRLRVFLDLRYPLIIDECEAAIRALVPDNKVHRLERKSRFIERADPSNVEISAFSKSWPCLFPQHGPGKKHEREIVLADWQVELVDRHPDQLLRGLIQSDGCRFTNTGRNNWVCPRYAFSQKSDDIRAIFCDACDRMGVRWTKSGTRNIYVSRKADVAFLDTFIGPKR
jgi:hypothetical protein